MTARAERKLLRRLGRALELQRHCKTDQIIAGHPHLAGQSQSKIAQLEAEREACCKRLDRLARPHVETV
ncbi:hypothetical protein [Frigoribacterium sp. CG_9.8]|uniref:hypothetical protein n=1 Tax=Frigoribacterium sp. CG_9.8 TaxID=2787733 RepID=UPI0018CB8C77|nr:hypothetical protein [Frigoribacterium sp. CG_9.8]MBG6106609.1 hypothetical protein [Frigoribacterium sp. CG_9.8]